MLTGGDGLEDMASEGLGRAAGAAGRVARAAADEFGNMAPRATQGFREEAGRAAEEAGRRAGSAGGVLRDVGKIVGVDVPQRLQKRFCNLCLAPAGL